LVNMLERGGRKLICKKIDVRIFYSM